MTALAHAGHWIASLAAAVPVGLVGAWIVFVTLRDRRRRRQSGSGASRR